MRLLQKNIAWLFQILSLMLFAEGVEVDLAIVGGGPSGLTAGLYGARSGLTTLVLEGETPGQLTFSHIVENYPGTGKEVTGQELIQSMRKQAESFGAQVKNMSLIEANLKQAPFHLKLSDGSTVLAKSLIVATGAKTQWLHVKNEQTLMGNGVSACAICDGPFFRNEHVVVVGGGDSAFEEALYLTQFASQVTLIHRSDRFRASEHLQKKVLHHPKITLQTFTQVTEVLGNVETGVVGLKIDKKDEGEKTIACKALFVAIGHLPNTKLFENDLLLDAKNYIVTKPGTTQTSVPGVFAAGDVADTRYRQAITAAGTGCMAALDAYDYLKTQDNSKSN